LSRKQTSQSPLNNKIKQSSNYSNKLYNQQRNKIRTNLLLLAFQDLKDQKENSQTKINSLSIKEAEKEYTKLNDCSVKLKPETTFSNSKKGVYHVKSHENLNNHTSNQCVDSQSNHLSVNYLKADYKHNSCSISITHSPNFHGHKLQNKYNSNVSKKRNINSTTSIKFSSSSVSSSDNYSSSNNSSHFGYLNPIKRKTSFAKKKLDYFTQTLLSSYDEKDITRIASERAREHSRYNSEVIIIKEDSPIKFGINQSYDSEYGLSEKNKKRAHEGFEYLQNLVKSIIKKKKRKVKKKSSDLGNDELVIKNDLYSQLSYEMTNDTSFSPNTLKNLDMEYTDNFFTDNNHNNHSEKNFYLLVNGIRPIKEEEKKTKNPDNKFKKSGSLKDSYKQSKFSKIEIIEKEKQNVGFLSNVDLHFELLRELESQSQKNFKQTSVNEDLNSPKFPKSPRSSTSLKKNLSKIFKNQSNKINKNYY
jgi:hypothetical protein